MPKKVARNCFRAGCCALVLEILSERRVLVEEFNYNPIYLWFVHM